MIKRIIFDIDDTLIDWPRSGWGMIDKAIEDIGLTHIKGLKENTMYVIDKYEEFYLKYDEQSMSNLLRQKMGMDIPDSYIRKSIRLFFRNFTR